MRWLLTLVILAAAGCNTPTPEFYGSAQRDVVLGDAEYRVFWSEDRAQAIRMSSQWGPSPDPAGEIAAAIQLATSCTVVGVMQGDAVLAPARIDCGGGTRPWAEAPAPGMRRQSAPDYECDLTGLGSGTLYCTAY